MVLRSLGNDGELDRWRMVDGCKEWTTYQFGMAGFLVPVSKPLLTDQDVLTDGVFFRNDDHLGYLLWTFGITPDQISGGHVSLPTFEDREGPLPPPNQNLPNIGHPRRSWYFLKLRAGNGVQGLALLAWEPLWGSGVRALSQAVYYRDWDEAKQLADREKMTIQDCLLRSPLAREDVARQWFLQDILTPYPENTVYK